jgi:hypothetical protein
MENCCQPLVQDDRQADASMMAQPQMSFFPGEDVLQYNLDALRLSILLSEYLPLTDAVIDTKLSLISRDTRAFSFQRHQSESTRGQLFAPKIWPLSDCNRPNRRICLSAKFPYLCLLASVARSIVDMRR